MSGKLPGHPTSANACKLIVKSKPIRDMSPTRQLVHTNQPGSAGRYIPFPGSIIHLHQSHEHST